MSRHGPQSTNLSCTCVCMLIVCFCGRECMCVYFCVPDKMFLMTFCVFICVLTNMSRHGPQSTNLSCTCVCMLIVCFCGHECMCVYFCVPDKMFLMTFCVFICVLTNMSRHGPQSTNLSCTCVCMLIVCFCGRECMCVYFCVPDKMFLMTFCLFICVL